MARLEPLGLVSLSLVLLVGYGPRIWLFFHGTKPVVGILRDPPLCRATFGNMNKLGLNVKFVLFDSQLCQYIT